MYDVKKSEERGGGIMLMRALPAGRQGDVVDEAIHTKNTINDKRLAISGFTLIELVLTIALLGVMAVAVTVMVINPTRANAEVAAQKARSDIEHARSLAMMKKGTTFGVYFDDSADEYTVYETAVANPVPNPQTKQDLIEDFTKYSGVTITGGDYTVEFDSLGAPTVGGGGSVQITDGSNTYTISINASTGRVDVQ